METALFSERVCVVISPPDIPEDDVRRRLGSALPLMFTRWEHRAYLASIRRLRPRVIVVVSADERARDYAALLDALLDSNAPTIAMLALTHEYLAIHQLGARTRARIHSLDDLLPG
jgi:hypothetical protein